MARSDVNICTAMRDVVRREVQRDRPPTDCRLRNRGGNGAGSFVAQSSIIERASGMLEIIALCSCACLACLWCALAFEVARSKRGWTLRNPCERPWSRRKCVCRECVTGQTRGSPCKNSRSRSSCASPSYKFVCKACRRVKPECICAKLFWHNVTADRCANCQPAGVTCNSFLPDLTCQETPSEQVTPRGCQSREHRSNKTKKTKKRHRHSVPKSILRKKCPEKERCEKMLVIE